MAVIEEVTAEFEKVRSDREFLAELDRLQREYTGRPSPLYPCVRLNEHAGGAQVYLKREDLNHTGSHKINNVLGQVLLAKRMGKPRVIAETGAGSTASPRRPPARCSASSASSTWARSIPTGRRSTSRGCASSAPRSSPSPRAPLRSRTRSTRRCATGSATPTPPTTVSARPPGRTRSRSWCATCSASSVWRRASRSSRRRAACPTPSSPAWAAAPTPSGSSIRSSRTRASASSGARPRATGRDRQARRDVHRRQSRRLPGRVLVPAAGRGRPDRRIAFHLRRPGLPRRGAGARAAQGVGPRRVRAGHRRRGDGRLRAAVPHRGHHPRDRVGARRRGRAATRAGTRPGRGDRGEPVRPRRQGRRHRREVVRPPRRQRGRGGSEGGRRRSQHRTARCAGERRGDERDGENK